MNNTTDSFEDIAVCADYLGFMPPDKFIKEENEKEDIVVIAFIRVISLCITIIGLTGNSITIYKITKDIRFHRPVFILLRCLAVSDLFSLVVNYPLKFTNFQTIIINCTVLSSKIPTEIYDILVYWSQQSSCFHIVLLAGYRCFLFKSPIKCQQSISYSKIVKASITIWIISLIVAIVFAVAAEITEKYAIVNLVYSGYVFSVPLTLILTFHLTKMRHAPVQNESLLRSSVKFLSNSLRRRLNIVFLIVLTLFGVPCVFQIVWFTLFLVYKCGITDIAVAFWEDRMNRATSVAWLFNYAIHPIVYFFNSKQVRGLLCR